MSILTNEVKRLAYEIQSKYTAAISPHYVMLRQG